MRMRYDQLSPIPPLTKVTKVIIVACVATYFLDFALSSFNFAIGEYSLQQVFGLVPAYIKKGWWWQFVTYIFMHGHPLHILLNMLILWYFGAEIEMRLGEREFLKYFFVCGIGAGLFNFGVNVAVADISGLLSPIIGASGAIYGILVAYGIFFGNRYFLVFFIFPMKAKYFVMIMAGIELVMGVKATPQDNVAHFAHLGGMAVGALYIYFMYIRRAGSRRGSKRSHEREKLRRQFKLIVNHPEDDNKGEDDGPSYWN